MTDTPGREISDKVRQLAEGNIQQARQAYGQFLEMVRTAQEMAAHSSGSMTRAALEIQSRAMRFTEENIESSFRLAFELARARDLKDYFEIQSRHAEAQVQAYARQAQELGRLIAEAAQKARPEK